MLKAKINAKKKVNAKGKSQSEVMQPGGCVTG